MYNYKQHLRIIVGKHMNTGLHLQLDACCSELSMFTGVRAQEYLTLCIAVYKWRFLQTMSQVCDEYHLSRANIIFTTDNDVLSAT